MNELKAILYDLSKNNDKVLYSSPSLEQMVAEHTRLTRCCPIQVEMDISFTDDNKNILSAEHWLGEKEIIFFIRPKRIPEQNIEIPVFHFTNEDDALLFKLTFGGTE